MKKLNLNAIRIDGGTQARVEINMDAVGDYAEALKVGIELPPVVVFHDGADHWLADGFHRYHAHKQADKASIAADVRNGTVRDAVLFSLGANWTHGLRRTNADKRKAVETMLADAEWVKWSDNKIAQACGVSDKTVAVHRAAIFGNSEDAKPATRIVERAGKAYEQDTTRIGKTGKTAPAEPPKKQKREIAPPPPSDTEQVAEAQHTIAELAQENEQLRDKLAVESLMDSEEAKTQLAETVAELRAQVKTLQAENAALKVSRDTYQREAAEAKKSALYWKREAEKAAKVTA